MADKVYLEDDVFDMNRKEKVFYLMRNRKGKTNVYGISELPM